MVVEVVLVVVVFRVFSAKLTVWLHRNWKLNKQCLDFL